MQESRAAFLIFKPLLKLGLLWYWHHPTICSKGFQRGAHRLNIGQMFANFNACFYSFQTNANIYPMTFEIMTFNCTKEQPNWYCSKLISLVVTSSCSLIYCNVNYYTIHQIHYNINWTMWEMYQEHTYTMRATLAWIAVCSVSIDHSNCIDIPNVGLCSQRLTDRLLCIDWDGWGLT